MTKKSRIEWVDVAKGVGILLVVFGHLIDGRSFPGLYIWSFHMPLFFFLSGLFMSETISLQAIAKRARQLLLPCFVFTAISCIVQYYVLGNSLDFLCHSLPVPLWFLTTLFLCDVWCRCLCRVMNVWLVLSVSLALSFFLQYYNIGTIYSLSSVFPASVFYLLGNIFNRFKISSMGGAIYLLFVLPMIPLLIILFNLHTNLDSNAITWAGYIVAVLGICQTIMISNKICQYRMFNNILSFLGRNSLVIMLTHFIFLQLYCHYVNISSELLYKVMQVLFVFAMSIGSIFVFRGKMSILLGKESKL